MSFKPCAQCESNQVFPVGADREEFGYKPLEHREV